MWEAEKVRRQDRNGVADKGIKIDLGDNIYMAEDAFLAVREFRASVCAGDDLP
jgi:hypothetical protein